MTHPPADRTGAIGVEIAIEAGVLAGDLSVPAEAEGIVAFAHGSGSSRLSPRNQQVATALQEVGLATLLMDLLTGDEEATDMRTGHLRFDIGLLGRRMTSAVDWLVDQPESKNLRIGLFGASTGAAAALVAAAERPEHVAAVVSRGGRPDLAREALSRVETPTLLIVGGEDHPLIEMNRDARSRMTADVRLEIVAGATHLFEEPGALEQVARLAGEHFRRHLTG